MAAIKGKNTKPELLIRQQLHARGLRYKLHDKSLPGKPDLVFPKHHAVILINGCFWHGHECETFRWPSTRAEFWREKILATKARDKKKVEELRNAGWRCLIIWECLLRGGERANLPNLASKVERWIQSDSEFAEFG
jgi:DNA mismatch endonuclease (patch repair protein)